ncbi:hypothetical protein HK099_008170 [Clydaea vesicula]|uniref:GID complex catalytic subunit 2 n=1 Tax=Clydaea vesicula TaxID=447962 RepID=A0AAD5U831_9FUNG|nr:hypothetical protein HK099_008170 [Clydaea vesicula]
MSAIMKLSKGLEWSAAGELPVEIPLLNSQRYHSIFSCPVTKEQGSEENPPMMINCGHVVAKESLNRLSKGPSKFKCPYCPIESTASQAMRGYATLLTLSGFVFGFSIGIIPAYFGGWFGGKSIGYNHFIYVLGVVTEGGLKLVTLIRIAPYPFGIMSVLLSATSVSLKQYLIAMTIACLKNSIHVWVLLQSMIINCIKVGSTIRELSDFKKSTILRNIENHTLEEREAPSILDFSEVHSETSNSQIKDVDENNLHCRVCDENIRLIHDDF